MMGRKPLESIQGGIFGVILLDIMLPEINGMEICCRVRQFLEVPNAKTHEVVQKGEVVSLMKKEYDLLEMFLRNKGIVLTQDRLLESL